jgi:hypothetical protein
MDGYLTRRQNHQLEQMVIHLLHLPILLPGIKKKSDQQH